LIRYKLKNEVRKGLYWENEDKRTCRTYERKEKT